jgi:hypothetical protein
MTRSLRHLALVALLAVLGSLMLAPAGASAATATAGCDWHEMLDAAANDRQISMHTSACYERALAAVPADTDAFQPEVRANLIAAWRRDSRIRVTSNNGTISRQLQASNDPVVASSVHGPVTNLLESLGPAHVDQVPLPVVALGGVASVLLLAGLGTSLARVRQRRAAR